MTIVTQPNDIKAMSFVIPVVMVRFWLTPNMTVSTFSWTSQFADFKSPSNSTVGIFVDSMSCVPFALILSLVVFVFRSVFFVNFKLLFRIIFAPLLGSFNFQVAVREIPLPSLFFSVFRCPFARHLKNVVERLEKCNNKLLGPKSLANLTKEVI